MNSRDIGGTAVLFGALHVGALGFVSFCSTPAIVHLTKVKDHNKVVSEFFPVWWIAGRNFMGPLGAISGLSYIAASYHTGNNKWLIPACLSLAIFPHTYFFMGTPIKNLMKSTDDIDVQAEAKKFVGLHQIRLLLSVAGLGYALYLHHM